MDRPSHPAEGKEPRDLDAQIAGVAALAEPLRRALYRFIATQDEAVSRDAAAAGVGIPRHVAKFHLDRLEADGLLEVEFSRPPGRTGPGAGRPAKRYRRSPRELAVTVPERRYDLAGRIMASAITAAQRGPTLADALHDAAAAMGRSISEEARGRAAWASGAIRPLTTASELLDEYGYESRLDAGCITLTNCPFHALAHDYRDLVCGMNLDLLRGVIEGLGLTNVDARLDPSPGRCCVKVCPR